MLFFHFSDMMLLMLSPIRHDAGEGSLSLEGDDHHAVDGGRDQDMLQIIIIIILIFIIFIM